MSFSTVLTKSPAALLAYVSRLSKAQTTEGTSSTLLFTLSTNAPLSSLSSLVTKLSRSAKSTVGCLSDALPVSVSASTEACEEVFSCSLAFFEGDECTPFRSQLGGREAVTVGRAWKQGPGVPPQGLIDPTLLSQLSGQGEGGSNRAVDWEEVWRGSFAGKEDTLLPEELRGLRPEDVPAVIYLSTTAHEGLSSVLSSQFPNAISVGLLASPTPFVTGRPFTLFHNDRIHSDGAVGLALHSSKSMLDSRQAWSLDMKFPGLHALTPVLEVTRSEGNLIISLANANPTQLLLSALRKEGMLWKGTKDDELYIGVVDATNDQVEPLEVYRISSGDPTRGTLSLDSDRAPRAGTPIRLYHNRGKDAPRRLGPNTLSFMGLAQPGWDTSALGELVEEEGVRVLNSFVASSENGWVLSRDGEVPWRCVVGGGIASVVR